MKSDYGLLQLYGLEDAIGILGERNVNYYNSDEYKNMYSDECGVLPHIEFKYFIEPGYEFSGLKGPLGVMGEFLKIVTPDYDLATLFYLKSRDYTEENYLKNEPFKAIWEEYILLWNKKREEIFGRTNSPIRDMLLRLHEGNKPLNPYWEEFIHFSDSIIDSLLLKRDVKEYDLLINELFENIFLNVGKIYKALEMSGISIWSMAGTTSKTLSAMKRFYWDKEKFSKVEEVRRIAELFEWKIEGEEDDDDKENEII